MSSVLVDSNVLIDVITNDPVWYAWSATEIERAANHARLVINPIIFAEMSVGVARIEDLDEILPASYFAREDLPYAAAFLAGRSFKLYRDRGGIRRSPLPDFFIGAHAAVAGYRLLTHDAARYRTYFPKLELITPEAS